MAKKQAALSAAEKKEIPAEFTGIWIPAAIYRYRELDSLDREIIGCINGFNNGGKKYVSVSYIARLINTHRTNVSKRVSKLIKDGFLSSKDCNSKRGGFNILILSDKARGMDLNDYEDELQPSNDGASKGGCSGAAHPVAERHTGVAERHTYNKEIINNRSSKRDDVAEAEPEFNFTEAFALVLGLVSKQLNIADVPEAVLEAIWLDYQTTAKRPGYGNAVAFVLAGIQQHTGTLRRSMKISQSRDELASARVKHLNAQTSLADQKARETKPRTTADRFDDSWATMTDREFFESLEKLGSE